MKNYLIIFCILLSCQNPTKEEFILQKGDLLFQDLDSSPLCDAIEIVTPGFKNGNFSHIGIVIETGDNSKKRNQKHVRILEAIPNKVKTTRLDSFINRSLDEEGNPKVIVGRLKNKYLYTIEDAIKFLKSKIGVKYDDYFLINNNAYYCSELIYEAFINDSVFKLEPMTFLHPLTLDTIEIWKEYYSKLKMEIPEKKPGINPGIMSISKNIDIIHKYGKPKNMED